ncbi:hypothetical protein [Saliphagus infecundisoli]|uniref:Restriction endonuclease type IV Mrr domain-containing protein n=1 Tax=Saliphagus infecundisoli TaxID=1849069 RepID=A0ABD5QC16_9EURY|nr:hypothetical protein [Saliphagus infecundisoli]
MPSFIEAEIQHRLWLWLEETQGYDVWPEVTLDKGRVDLLAETPDGEHWGYEVKGASNINLSTIKQLHKYLESGYLDRIFFASYEVDNFLSLVEDNDYHYLLDHGKCYEAAAGAHQLIDQGVDPSQITNRIQKENPNILEIQLEGGRRLEDNRTFEQWMSQLPNWKSGFEEEHQPTNPNIEDVVSTISDAINWFPYTKQFGVVQVPLDVEQVKMGGRTKINEDLGELLTSQPSTDPRVIREAGLFPRERTISPVTNESSLHHAVWQEFGGLPEGALPNSKRGKDPVLMNTSINIDLLSFDGGTTATEIMESGGKVVGIEAKTRSGLNSTERLNEQLVKYTKGGGLTHIYLAIPASDTDKAITLLDQFSSSASEKCGVIGVNNDGSVDIEMEAKEFSLENDGYGSPPEYPFYIGYGNADISDAPGIISCFSHPDE